MATYYVVCITKHPTHSDPHTSIQAIGTSITPLSTIATKKWPLADVVRALKAGDTFYCRDRKGDQVKCVPAKHDGHDYVKTENDGIKPDNLLWQKDC